MNAKEHTRANKWAAHVKESSMNRRDEVGILGQLERARTSLTDSRPKKLNNSKIGGSSLTCLILLNWLQAIN